MCHARDLNRFEGPRTSTMLHISGCWSIGTRLNQMPLRTSSSTPSNYWDIDFCREYTCHFKLAHFTPRPLFLWCARANVNSLFTRIMENVLIGFVKKKKKLSSLSWYTHIVPRFNWCLTKGAHAKCTPARISAFIYIIYYIMHSQLFYLINIKL